MGGKGGGGSPEAPNYSGVIGGYGQNAGQSQQYAEQQMEWAKGQFAENRDLFERILDTQLPIMQSEAGAGAQLRQRYEQVFQPLEDALIKDANEYASGDRADFNAGRAIAEVGKSFDAARSNALARMESYGVDPSQTRSAALDAGIRVQEAAAKAAAGTQSRLQTEDTGRQLRGQAIQLGQATQDNAAKAYQTALGAGQAGMGNALSTTQSGAQTMGTANQWMGTANQSFAGQGQMMSQQYQDQMKAQEAKNAESSQMGSSIGSIAGMAIGTMIAPGVGTALGGAIGGAAGGALMARGGRLPEDPNDPEGKHDTFDAKLASNEFVIPASVVRRLGSDHFDKLIARYGDEEDRPAAIHRMKTGMPGGEPYRGMPPHQMPQAKQAAIHRVGA